MYFTFFILALSLNLSKATTQAATNDSVIQSQRDLLENIAKKIEEEVTSTVKPNKSTEVTNSKVKKHEEYPPSIFREESDHLRNVSSDSLIKDVHAPSTSSLRDIDRDYLRVGSVEETSGLDLTLRTGHKDKDNSTQEKEKAESIVHQNVSNSSDSAIKITEKPLLASATSESNIIYIKSQTPINPGYRRVIPGVTPNAKNYPPNSNEHEINKITTTPTADTEVPLSLDLDILDKLHNQPESTVSNSSKQEANSISKRYGAINAQENNSSNPDTETSVEITTILSNRPVNVINENNNETLTANASNEQDIKSSSSGTESSVEITTVISNRPVNVIDENNDTLKADTVNSNNETVTVTSKSYKDVTPMTTSVPNLRLSTDNTKEGIQVTSTVQQPIERSKDNESSNENIYEYPTTVTVLIPMKQLIEKHGPATKDTDQVYRQENDVNEQNKAINSDKNAVNEYKVFEVEPEASDFGPITPIPPNPQHVPVYNYDPANAYFNAYNRYGPNDKSEFTDHNQFQEKHFLNNTPIKNTQQMPQELKVNKTIHFFKLKQKTHKKEGLFDDLRTIFSSEDTTPKRLKHIDVPFNPNISSIDRWRQYAYNNNLFAITDNPLSASSEIERIRMTLQGGHDSKGLKDLRTVNQKAFFNISGENKLQSSSSSVKKEQNSNDQNRIFNIPDKFSVDYFFGRSEFDKSNDMDNNNPLSNSSKLTIILNNQIYKETFLEGNKKAEVINKLENIINKSKGDDIVVTINNVKRFNKILPFLTTGETELNPPNKKHQKMPRKDSFEVKNLVIVLMDMIRNNHSKLVSYDWFRTTVDIQSALHKLNDLIFRVKTGTKVNDLDLQLLKLAVYVHNKATNNVKHSKHQISAPVGRMVLPKSNKTKKQNALMMIKKLFQLLKAGDSRYSRSRSDKVVNSRDLNKLKSFVDKTQTALSSLHLAVKQLTQVTKFRNQNWYHDLKDLFFSHATSKELRVILLHLFIGDAFDQLEAMVRDADGHVRGLYSKEKGRIDGIVHQFQYSVKILDDITRRS